jgi:DNA-binding NarL/FixJ family response regulator
LHVPQIIVADDHPLFRKAAAVSRLDRDLDFIEGGFVAAMLAAVERNRVRLLLLDLNIPGAYGFNAAHVRGSRPELPVVIV